MVGIPFWMAIYAALYCPAPATGAQVTILPNHELATLADKLNLHGASALATWTNQGHGRIYLTNQADGRLLCHEIKHIPNGYWHDSRHSAEPTALSTKLPAPYLNTR